MEIDNLEEKLEGKLPVNRDELIELINSHGRYEHFRISNYGVIERCHPNECYPLEKLDVSQIVNLSEIFGSSLYNGDLSKWDVSNCLMMNSMFQNSKFNNNSISNWNISNVISMNYIFFWSSFANDISKWNLREDIECKDIFFNNFDFKIKYNDGKAIPNNTKDFLDWFENNRSKISNLSVTNEDIFECDDYLSSFTINALQTK